MGINFPNAPTVGQLWPQPYVSGPLYQWDGVKWGSTSAVATTGAVRYDVAQTLSSDTMPVGLGQRSQARSNIYAAPFDALAYSGMQLNGNMEVAQLYGTSAVALPTGTIGRVVDNWIVFPSGCACTAQMVSDAPPGYGASLKISVTTADPSPAANDFLHIYNSIEAYRVERLAFGTALAAPVSFGFWVKANRPGLYGGTIRNGPATRSYPFTFTVSASATWQFITLTVPGDTTTSSGSSNAPGLHVTVSMMTSTGYSGPAGAWMNGNILGANGAINGVAATTDYMQLTGLIVLPGLELPSASRAPFIMRSSEQEAIFCYRYLQFNRERTPGFLLGGTAPSLTPTFVFNHAYILPMRISTPTVTLNPNVASVAVECLPWQAGYTLTGVTVNNSSHCGAYGGDFQVTGTANAAVGAALQSPAAISGAGQIMFDARI